MLGDVCGLTQFGVNLTRLKPGAVSAHRHWHENEDEFVYIVEGEATLWRMTARPFCAPAIAPGWKAGVAVGHCLVNKSQTDVVYSRNRHPGADGHMSLSGRRPAWRKDERGVRFTRKNGEANFEESRKLSQLYRRIETCGKPWVAAMNGTAFGGGFELGLACHHRVAADNDKTRLGLPEIKVGLFPGAGGTTRMSRMMLPADALQFLLKGEQLKGCARRA